jgi:hypothetical protein
MKTLTVWEDWDGNIIFNKSLDDIQTLNISIIDEKLSIVLVDGFFKTFSIKNDGMNYSFNVK